MSDEGRRLPMARPQGCCKIRELAQRHSENAMTVLVTIMSDETAAATARIAAANSVLAWRHAGCRADLAVNSGGQLKRTAVGVEWSGPLRALGDPN
jgi:hypothetical protein